MLQHTLQTAAKRGTLDLLGIATADCVDRVGEDQPGLHQVQLAVELHLMPVEVSPVESGQQHVPVPELPLIGHVVDREQTGDPFIPRRGAILDFQVGRNQAGLPIVGMQHVDVQVEQPNCLEDRAAEEDKPLAIVDVVLAVGPVEFVAIEVLILLDQVDRHVATRQRALKQMAGDHLAADRYDEIDPGPLDGLSSISGFSIGRHDQYRMVT